MTCLCDLCLCHHCRAPAATHTSTNRSSCSIRTLLPQQWAHLQTTTAAVAAAAAAQSLCRATLLPRRACCSRSSSCMRGQTTMACKSPVQGKEDWGACSSYKKRLCLSVCMCACRVLVLLVSLTALVPTTQRHYASCPSLDDPHCCMGCLLCAVVGITSRAAKSPACCSPLAALAAA